MSAIASQALHPLTRDEYLGLEQRTGTRHEYMEGVAYAMVGGTDAHNLIAMNLAAALHARRGDCEVFQQGMKLRIETEVSEAFYYPDVMVCCDRSDRQSLWRERPSLLAEVRQSLWRERPSLLAEVLSPSTENNDWGVKLILYRSIPSLSEYLAIRASAAEATIYRRGAGWKAAAVDLDRGLDLESLRLRIDFATLYDGVSF
jgi:Uma2 family endonuclease